MLLGLASGAGRAHACGSGLSVAAAVRNGQVTLRMLQSAQTSTGGAHAVCIVDTAVGRLENTCVACGLDVGGGACVALVCRVGTVASTVGDGLVAQIVLQSAVFPTVFALAPGRSRLSMTVSDFQVALSLVQSVRVQAFRAHCLSVVAVALPGRVGLGLAVGDLGEAALVEGPHV